MLDFLRKKQSKVDYLRGQLGAFAHENKDVLIIVADPETDHMFVSYKDKMILAKLKSLEGSDLHIVKGVLRQSAMKSKFDEGIERLIGGMVDVLKLSVPKGNQFYTFIADALFHFQDKAKVWLEKKAKSDEILHNNAGVEADLKVKT